MLDFDEVVKCNDVQELNHFIDKYVQERGLKGEAKSRHTWALFYTWRQFFLKRKIKNLSSFLTEIKECNQCKQNPVVFITENREKMGLCQKHWDQLAESGISFSERDKLQYIKPKSLDR